MSAQEIIAELPKLSAAERKDILENLLKLASGQTTIKETATNRQIELRERGMTQTQAANLRQRGNTFAKDWNRPEMDVYDED